MKRWLTYILILSAIIMTGKAFCISHMESVSPLLQTATITNSDHTVSHDTLSKEFALTQSAFSDATGVNNVKTVHRISGAPVMAEGSGHTFIHYKYHRGTTLCHTSGRDICLSAGILRI